MSASTAASTVSRLLAGVFFLERVCMAVTHE
jgi:hypothetical protein